MAVADFDTSEGNPVAILAHGPERLASIGAELPGYRPELAPRLVGGDPVLCVPGEVHRILYTTNTIEALNAKLRWAVQVRGDFPTDDAALKLLFLVLHRAEKAWIMSPREWTMAKAQLAIFFDERFSQAQA